MIPLELTQHKLEDGSSPSSDFGSNAEADPDAGFWNNLLENVMDQTANTCSCPGVSHGVGGVGGEKEGTVKEEDDDEADGSISSRNLDQELEDLDIGYDMFDASASIKSVDDTNKDATAADNKTTQKEGKNIKKKEEPANKTKTPSRQKESNANANLDTSASSISKSSSTETKWDKRATRPQLFETSYIALRTEEYEVATLAASLGVPKPTRFDIPVNTLIRSAQCD
jgi:hypothetical protein